MQHIDVVVGMNGRLAADRSARKLATPIGHDFVYVHVELRAASRHPDVQGKHVGMLAGEDLVARFDDEFVLVIVQPLARVVCVSSGFL